MNRWHSVILVVALAGQAGADETALVEARRRAQQAERQLAERRAELARLDETIARKRVELARLEQMHALHAKLREAGRELVPLESQLARKAKALAEERAILEADRKRAEAAGQPFQPSRERTHHIRSLELAIPGLEKRLAEQHARQAALQAQWSAARFPPWSAELGTGQAVTTARAELAALEARRAEREKALGVLSGDLERAQKALALAEGVQGMPADELDRQRAELEKQLAVLQGQAEQARQDRLARQRMILDQLGNLQAPSPRFNEERNRLRQQYAESKVPTPGERDLAREIEALRRLLQLFREEPARRARATEAEQARERETRRALVEQELAERRAALEASRQQAVRLIRQAGLEWRTIRQEYEKLPTPSPRAASVVNLAGKLVELAGGGDTAVSLDSLSGALQKALLADTRSRLSSLVQELSTPDSARDGHVAHLLEPVWGFVKTCGQIETSVKQVEENEQRVASLEAQLAGMPR